MAKEAIKKIVQGVAQDWLVIGIVEALRDNFGHRGNLTPNVALPLEERWVAAEKLSSYRQADFLLQETMRILRYADRDYDGRYRLEATVPVQIEELEESTLPDEVKFFFLTLSKVELDERGSNHSEFQIKANMLDDDSNRRFYFGISLGLKGEKSSDVAISHSLDGVGIQVSGRLKTAGIRTGAISSDWMGSTNLRFAFNKYPQIGLQESANSLATWYKATDNFGVARELTYFAHGILQKRKSLSSLI